MTSKYLNSNFFQCCVTLLICILFFSGCAQTIPKSLKALLPGSNLISSYDTIRETLKDSHQLINEAQLSPEYGYLRFWLRDQEALLVRELDILDRDQSNSSPPTIAQPTSNQVRYARFDGPFVWYSSDRHVLKTQNGRYMGSIGLEKNWANLQIINAPNWEQVLVNSKRKPVPASRAAFVPPLPLAGFKRSYNQIPTANMLVQERVAVFKLDATPKDIPATVFRLLNNLPNPQSVHWFLELVESSNIKQTDSIRGYYALTEGADGKASLVFAQQCLTKDLCFAWMPWGQK